MKALGEAKKILSMAICRVGKYGVLLAQKEYIGKVFARFSMKKTKAVSTPIHWHIKLSNKAMIFDEDKAYVEVYYVAAVERCILRFALSMILHMLLEWLISPYLILENLIEKLSKLF